MRYSRTALRVSNRVSASKRIGEGVRAMKRIGENPSGHWKGITLGRIRSSRVFVLPLVLIGLLLAIGLAVSAQPYPVTVTITGDATDPSVVGQAYSVDFEVRITPVDTLSPWGTVTVSDGTGGTCTKTLTTEYYPNGWGSWCNLTSTSAGTKTITATFVPYDGNFTGGSDTETHVVNRAATSTVVTSSGSPSVVGQPVTFTATISPTSPGGGTPTGMVAFYAGTTLLGSASSASTNVMSFVTDQLSVGTHAITAEYAGNDDYVDSTSSSITQEVTKRLTTTVVFCADTPLIVQNTATCTVTVIDISPGTPSVPTGSVSVSVAPSGDGTLTHASHPLTADDGGQFTFTYKPTDGDNTPHVISASYNGDGSHLASSGDFSQAIVKRALDMEMTLAPTTAYVLQPVSITVHMEDDTTEGTPDSLSGLEIVLDNGGKSGTFSDDTPTLNSSGNCTVTYTPGAGDAGSSSAITTITASYEGSEVYAAKQLSQQLTVQLRPTLTTVEFNKTEGIYVYEPATFTVTVVDTAGTASDPVSPEGSITISAEKTFYGGTRGVSYSSDSTPDDYTHVWNYDYLWTALIAEGADYDVVTATYTPNDGIHLPSEGRYGKGVNRRPTEVTITCVAGTPTGFTVLAQVAEKAGVPGILSIPLGDFVMLVGEDLSETDVGDAPLASIDIVTELPIVSPTILYSPSDFIHVKSPGTPAEPCTKIIDTSGGGDGTTGGACADGCGSGG
ncbi:MAG: Ig-like domain repeat protein, partial [Candidatus Atribacteria bacterium]